MTSTARLNELEHAEHPRSEPRVGMSRDADRARRSIRLAGYDYTQSGAYFVTICTAGRALLFDHAPFAEIATREWERSALLRREVSLDAFVVMPNHIHGIVWLDAQQASAAYVEVQSNERRHPQTVMPGQHASAAQVGAQGLAPLRDPPQPVTAAGRPGVPPRSLGSFVRGYKSGVTVAVNALRGTSGAPVWQRNYYEHIIRDEADLHRVRRYIANNPLRWAFDRENPRGRPDRHETDFWSERS